MELRKIRALAALMNEQGLTCVTLKEGEDQVELRRECSAPAAGALPAESREKSGEAPAPAGQAVPAQEAISASDRSIMHGTPLQTGFHFLAVVEM